MSSTPHTTPQSPMQAPTPCRKLEPEQPALVAWLRAIPVAVQAGVVLVLLVLGVWLGGPIGGGLLLLVAAGMLAALGLTWRALALPERLLRFAVAFLVLALALVRMFPR